MTIGRSTRPASASGTVTASAKCGRSYDIVLDGAIGGLFARAWRRNVGKKTCRRAPRGAHAPDVWKDESFLGCP
jgi:hypothetical protein